MRKDPTEFRERFQRWKNGEQVYENGLALPAYEDGKTPMLDRLEYDDDGTNYIQYRKQFLDRLWSPEEQKQLKFDPERDALRAMLVNDYASFNAGTLPGVVIRPPKDSKKVLSEAKEMLPIDKMRHNWYDWIDTMRDFHYPDRNMDPYEYVRRMYNIYNASGKPSVSTTKTPEYAVHNPFNIHGKDRQMYNGILNRMYLDPDDPGFADEMSHAFQNNTDVPFDWDPLPGDWEINGRNGYERPGHQEYTAHSIIQPLLERYLEDQDLNLSIDDMVKIVTNIHDNVKYQNNPARALNNILKKYKIKPKK